MFLYDPICTMNCMNHNRIWTKGRELILFLLQVWCRIGIISILRDDKSRMINAHKVNDRGEL